MLISPWPEVDQVREITPQAIVCTRGTTIGEDFYEHHFPTEPIVPAVLQLAWIEHAAGIWICHHSGGRLSAVLREIQRLSCLRIATPGDCLEIALRWQPAPRPRELAPEQLLAASALVTRGEARILRVRLVMEVVQASPALVSWPETIAEIGLAEAARRGGAQ